MKRSLLTIMGIMTLALAVPSAALAHHDHGHHHHKAKAKAHHAKFRIVHIGSTAGTTTTPTTTTPSATPPTPENAGTVKSYTGGVLTLTLGDNSTVSGKVTNNTTIGCIKATPTTSPAGMGDQPTDQSPGDNSQGDDQSGGDMSQQGDHESGDHESGEWQQGDHESEGDDEGEVPGAPEPPCDSSALVTGAVVRAAELRIGPGGTEFESVWLVR